VRGEGGHRRVTDNGRGEPRGAADAGNGLRTTDTDYAYGPRPTDHAYGLRTADNGQRTTDHRPQTTDHRPQTTDHGLRTTDHVLRTMRMVGREEAREGTTRWAGTSCARMVERGMGVSPMMGSRSRSRLNVAWVSQP